MPRRLGYFVLSNPAGRDQVRVVEELRRLRVPFTVIGGVAMAAYREARQTKDIDVIVSPPEGMDLEQLAEHLASKVPGAHAYRCSHERGKNYYRIMIPRPRKKPLPVADVAPRDLYPQYAAAHAAPRHAVIGDFDGYGAVDFAGVDELLALKIKAAVAPRRKFLAAAEDKVDAYWLVAKGANLARARALLADVPGGVDLLNAIARDYASRRRPNPRYGEVDLTPPRPPRPLGLRCPSCGRVVRVVRGGRLKAHDFNYRRCPGSGAPA